MALSTEVIEGIGVNGEKDDNEDYTMTTGWLYKFYYFSFLITLTVSLCIICIYTCIKEFNITEICENGEHKFIPLSQLSIAIEIKFHPSNLFCICILNHIM